jgi:hypothetical protein
MTVGSSYVTKRALFIREGRSIRTLVLKMKGRETQGRPVKLL